MIEILPDPSYSRRGRQFPAPPDVVFTEEPMTECRRKSDNRPADRPEAS